MTETSKEHRTKTDGKSIDNLQNVQGDSEDNINENNRCAVLTEPIVSPSNTTIFVPAKQYFRDKQEGGQKEGRISDESVENQVLSDGHDDFSDNSKEEDNDTNTVNNLELIANLVADLKKKSTLKDATKPKPSTSGMNTDHHCREEHRKDDRGLLQIQSGNV